MSLPNPPTAASARPSTAFHHVPRPPLHGLPQISTRAPRPPRYKKVDLKTFDLTSLGTKFDVILIDPPWEEYRRRKIACGAVMTDDDMDVWSPQVRSTGSH